MIKNGCEIKTWFLRVNYNAEAYNFAKEYLGNLYYISANISDNIKDLLLEKIGNDNLEYVGSVLQVSEKDGVTLNYFLNAYFLGKAEYNGYLVGFLTAELKNVTFAWKKYTKSKNYINIDIPSEDVIIDNRMTQGFKNENIYSNTRVNLATQNYGMTEFLDQKYRVRNFVNIIEDKSYLVEPNFFEYFYLSRTPSICLLADSICKQAKTYNLNVKNIRSSEKKNDNNELLHI